MPELHWSGKTKPEIPSTARQSLGLIYPGGNNLSVDQPSGRLIYGDNFRVMASLLPEYKGKINLIYMDPPFFSNRNYRARIGQGEDSRRPTEWQMAEGYQDNWVKIDDYLNMLYPRLILVHHLLANNGTLYLHLDWHASHYARLLLDEVFGSDRFLNEIIWVYHGPSPIRKAFNRKHDTLLVYTKSNDYTFNVDAVRQPYNPNTVKTFASSKKAGFGKVPDLDRGKVPEDWWYFPVVARLHNERTGYPTQKPEALLSRIISASSNTNDLVADFFCGSGTTLATASQLGRHFIGSDITWRAIYTSLSRLASSTKQPFSLEYDHLSSPPLIRAVDLGMQVLQSSPGVFTLQTKQPEEISYWEVDPAWDGINFRSLAQAVRPRRKADIPTTLIVPSERVGEKAKARLITIHGDYFEMPVFSIGN
jgi:site-specific DNA-methyltransferase (adenine-specific)